MRIPAKYCTKKMRISSGPRQARKNYLRRSLWRRPVFLIDRSQCNQQIQWPNRKLNIKAGDTYQRIDLLRALLVKSPNDVARCLARDNAGSIEAFAGVMNRRAQQLGAVHSHFVNPNGLPVPGQYSTARDLALIARVAYANPTIRSIVCLPQLVFRFA